MKQLFLQTVLLLTLPLLFLSCYQEHKYPTLDEVPESKQLPVDGTWELTGSSKNTDIVKPGIGAIKNFIGIDFSFIYTSAITARIDKGRVVVLDAPASIEHMMPIGSVILKDFKVRDKYSYTANRIFHTSANSYKELPVVIQILSDSVMVESVPREGFDKVVFGGSKTFVRYKLVNKMDME